MKKEQKKERKNLGRRKRRGRDWKRTKKWGGKGTLFRVRAANAGGEWELELAGELLSVRFWREMKPAPPFPAPPRREVCVLGGQGEEKTPISFLIRT